MRKPGTSTLESTQRLALRVKVQLFGVRAIQYYHKELMIEIIYNLKKMNKKKMHVMILGDGKVGKTSILKQYASKQYTSSHLKTIGKQ
jgi:GTPase SAR1 family protein